MKILFIIASVIVMYGCVQIIAYSLKQASNEWKEIKKLLWLVVTANVALTIYNIGHLIGSYCAVPWCGV